MRRAIAASAVAVAVGGVVTGASFAAFSTAGQGTTRFHVGEANGRVTVGVQVKGDLTPVSPADVTITLRNDTGWSVRVRRIAGSEPLVTDLPSGCPADAFDFKAVQVNRTLRPSDTEQASGQLTMDRGAPIDCAGSDPVLHLEVD